ncbi:TPA: 1-acyl-sn-glycerol-3-phosphate acyltransferase [Candidatus Gastranaerophilales bacterium HUM_15]|jgi:1-acyl-sn-glycerol-3-phosphate acyltransferase|nr:1-acyl-sn-glycerol-3-phosphate acyltransferase [Acinetobacter sp.]DAA97677.1 MAG TPA: 1-acyl-sn-glycerol-3-phosphate acyltransferase [Candidatus Gastranaerophilales bacterium HUM_10]DAB01667.1 MAG TPA: 1-acyl-sn-glycerol-3-phosphate acyltransferase [Candidatus Gastranaerophilales bacterium HUM_11]DAB07597.1 MAG TPA: 1-acyl-sn-glycerol-3-phosphate acyltransferase [Candidatus Gastranaerophilales bacterium HUM_15]DAB10505.1 MAG TPA: 1-acyl-sn-glycerol-3-phosphate acyltransferase [Candidatus Gas
MSNDKKTNGNKYSLRDAKFYNAWRRMFQFLVTHVFYMIRFKLVYRLEIYGKENIPSDNNFIVAANHLSTLDPPLVCGVMNRGVAYMAKKELFENPFMRWWLDWLGAFAVDREKLGVSTIKTVKNLKETGWVLGIFPQGTRQEAGEFSHITKGFASLAKSTKCGILPIGITGTQEVKRIPFTGKIIVRIGKIIPYTDDVTGMVDKWEKSIEDLTGFKYVEKDKVCS